MGFLKIIDDVADRKIREAYEQGEFKDLPGKGRPLTLEDDSMIPEDLRMAYKILRNSGYLPPEVQIVKDIRTSVDLLENCSGEKQKLKQMKKLEVLVTRLNSMEKGAMLQEAHPEYYRKVLERIRVGKA